MGLDRRTWTWLATAGLGAALLVAPTNSAQAADTPVARSPINGIPGAESIATGNTVTLITGDRVTVNGDQISVERDPTRTSVRFLSYHDGRHLRVIPSDALPLIHAGRLDGRLFDLTLLREYGYDDRRADLPLIVTYGGEAARSATRSTVTATAAVSRELPMVNGLAVRADKKAIRRLWNDLTAHGTANRTLSGGAARVWLDGLRRPSLDVSVPQIGAPTAWQAGHDGTGVTVAVLDTGIDATHPDLEGRVAGNQNFTEGTEDDRDLVGHGTHVASTIAGGATASDGRYKGVAPGARLLDGKVCVDGGCAESWILAGMEWATAEQRAPIVNMSLGGPDSPGTDLLEEAVQRLSEQYGTLFVIASGNDGADEFVSSPASADAALAVGAVDATDALADFSNRGPRVGDAAVKPDITAPGVEITAANGRDGRLGEPGEAYTTLSGTSMATPHVAGAAALLAQQHPGWSAPLLKATLMGSAKPTDGVDVYGQGAGRVDAATATTTTVTASPPSVSFGRQEWPHTDDQPVAQTVTYRNHGTTEVVLELVVAATGPDGTPAPAGMFALDRNRLTVPAGGQASAMITADTRRAPAGRFGGHLTATVAGTGAVTRTAFAVDNEAERYTLTLPHTTRSGAAAVDYSTMVFRLDTLESYSPYDADGSTELRLPRGRYAVFSSIFEGEEETLTSTLLAQPELELTASRTIVLDARLAKPVTVTVPNAAARGVWGQFGARTRADGVAIDLQMNMLSLSGFDRAYTGQIGSGAVSDRFSSVVSGTLAEVTAEGGFDNSPYAYHLTWFGKGRMLSGLNRRLGPRDLATVRQDYARHTTGTLLGATSYAWRPDLSGDAWTVIMQFTPPFTRTEYHNTDGGIRWNKSLQDRQPRAGQLPPLIRGTVTDRDLVYQAGRAYDERWNRGVFGPSLADPTASWQWVTRTGNVLDVAPPMFGDGAGRYGSSSTSSRNMTLYRNGEKYAEAALLSASIEVPADEADYRLQVTAERDATFPLSTRNSVVWTFRSGHVDGDDPVRLPLSVVSFAPPLDQENSAPAGQLFPVPVAVTGQPGATTGRITSVVLDVSFDDGRSWHRTEVPNGKRAMVRHPAGAGFVSLRARATDSAGNTVEQTIIRAYRITPTG